MPSFSSFGDYLSKKFRIDGRKRGPIFSYFSVIKPRENVASRPMDSVQYIIFALIMNMQRLKNFECSE